MITLSRGLILFSVLVCYSCSKRNCQITSRPHIASSEWNIKISAIDLSEDMSSLSSGEDEILVFLYTYEKELKAPLIAEEYQFLKGESQNWNFSYLCDTLLLIAVEKDSDRALKAIEAIVRVNANELIKAADLKDYVLEKEILDDEDLLFYQIMGASQNSFNKEGRKTMDRFVYEISISPVKPNR